MQEFISEELDDLKEYYDDLTDTTITEKGRKYGKELIDGGATYLDFAAKYSTFQLKQWVEQTLNMIGNYDPEDEDTYDTDADELLGLFPNIDDYYSHATEISIYLILKDLDVLKQHIENKDQFYIDEVIRMEWFELIPTVADIFLF